MIVEIELKYAISTSRAAQRWCKATGIGRQYTLVPADPAEIHLCDTYLDTADFRLLRHGCALRLRTGDGRHLLTVKSISIGSDELPDDALHQRLEIEAPLADAQDALTPARWPQEARNHIGALVSDDELLQPLVILHQVRQKRRLQANRSLLPAAQDFSAELSIDRVMVTDPLSTPHSSTDPTVTFQELEIELLSGDAAQLDAVSALLHRYPTLASLRASKLERALALTAEHPAGYPPAVTGLQADMPMAEALRTTLRIQLMAMMSQEAGARYSSETEYVHRMRVATRRARVAIKLFGAFLKEKQLRPFLKPLRKTARKLGVVRDLDVAIGNAQREQAGQCDPQVIAHWQTERQAAHQALIAWLGSKQYAAFLTDYGRFCTEPGAGAAPIGHKLGESPTPHLVCHVAPSLLVARFEQIRSYEPLFIAGPVEYPTIHALRIDCKYLRYALEFFRTMLGEDGEILIRRLKKLQDLLGELNDAVVAAEMLRSRPNGQEDDPRHLTHLEEETRRLSARVPEMLWSFTAPYMRQHLANAIARI